MKTVVEEMKANYERGIGFLFKQIDEASDEVWKTAKGKMGYWQHIYHAFACFDFFILPAGQGMDPGPATVDAAMFRETPREIPSKEAVREYGKKQKERADAWLNALKDEELGLKHEGFSSRKNEEMSNGRVLSNLVAHNFYHVGCNDTILREAGHPGVY